MRGEKCRVLLFCSIMLFALSARRGEAVNPETLLMPGKVSEAHQKYEEECTLCHDRHDRLGQTRLCRDCHKQIAADIDARRGFHGKVTSITTSQCSACHSEHQGRNGDLVKLSREQFDHDGTDFPLRGAHATLICDACHVQGKAYRKASPNCVDCHRKEEPHAGKLGTNCASCHNPSRWIEAQFDHDKTSFALRDKHVGVPCASCHLANRYKDTPRQCVSCHAPDDVHHGERGAKCADCHTPAGWKSATFDHGKETGFALIGAHDHIDCHDCHRSGNLHDKLPRECAGCHKGQDAHAGRFGSDCAKCHGSEKWRDVAFDHAREGHWELAGRHAQVTCESCHTARIDAQQLNTSCVSCHRPDDVHAGKLGRECDQCHTPAGWRTDVAFDHDFTRFPLVGLHVAVPCEQCHLSKQFRDVGTECIACHKKDDFHKGSVGGDCGKCHSPNGWRIWEFDHGKETKFALTGAHQRLACADCHREPADQLRLNPDCISCHAEDDVHLGQYGRQCERCHSPQTFKGARIQ